jgi:hypothetical protein
MAAHKAKYIGDSMKPFLSERMRRPWAALFWSLLIALPGSAGAFSETEPNNEWAAAQAIANANGDFLIDGTRSFADPSDDFFSFMVRGPGVLRIESSSTDGAADSIMGLFNAGGMLLASNDDGTGSMSTIVFNVTAPGTYSVGFSGFNPGLLACTGAVTACYDTDDDLVFDTFVAGGGAGGSTGWDYRISLSGVALVPEPHAALLLAPGLALLLMRRRRKSAR